MKFFVCIWKLRWISFNEWFRVWYHIYNIFQYSTTCFSNSLLINVCEVNKPKAKQRRNRLFALNYTFVFATYNLRLLLLKTIASTKWNSQMFKASNKPTGCKDIGLRKIQFLNNFATNKYYFKYCLILKFFNNLVIYQIYFLFQSKVLSVYLSNLFSVYI